MDIKITPSELSGEVRAIPSKSQAHRALICAALADKPTRISFIGDGSEDIRATAACLNALGASIEKDLSGYIVNPIRQPIEGSALPCGESGSTFRFLLPIAGALGISASFLPQGRLPMRPLSPLYEELIGHGCALSPQGFVPFEIDGQLRSGHYELDAGISSQFISGLLFALPLLSGDSEIQLSGQMESFPYIEITLATLKNFGIHVDFDGAVFHIKGDKKYISPGVLRVEGDWSNAAFWLCAGAMDEGGITVSNLDMQSKQGDRNILDILQRMGADIKINGDSISIKRGELRGVDIDAQDIPDLVPILAALCAVSEGISVISNAGRLRLKESDRLTAISSVLSQLGAEITEMEDALKITGKEALQGGPISSFHDHRIAMSAAIAASACASPVLIRGAEAVNKSYPTFFDDFASLGGKIEEV